MDIKSPLKCVEKLVLFLKFLEILSGGTYLQKLTKVSGSRFLEYITPGASMLYHVYIQTLSLSPPFIPFSFPTNLPPYPPPSLTHTLSVSVCMCLPVYHEPN